MRLGAASNEVVEIFVADDANLVGVERLVQCREGLHRSVEANLRHASDELTQRHRSRVALVKLLEEIDDTVILLTQASRIWFGMGYSSSCLSSTRPAGQIRILPSDLSVRRPCCCTTCVDRFQAWVRLNRPAQEIVQLVRLNCSGTVNVHGKEDERLYPPLRPQAQSLAVPHKLQHGDVAVEILVDVLKDIHDFLALLEQR